MQFSVGYQATDPYDFSDCVGPWRDSIREVYFPWPAFPDARGLSSVPTESRPFMEAELRGLHDSGVALNVLLNANCYGGQSISKRFKNTVLKAIGYLKRAVGLEAVTTTSLFVAQVAKSSYPDLDLRASVNMEIASVRGLNYVAEYFDSFYVGRDANRSPSRIAAMKKWCAEHGKKLYLLANSGCLRNCSAHTFHDNLVAHERELASIENEWIHFPGVCWRFLGRSEHRHSLVSDSTWLRPEDLGAYEGLVDGVKLATRSNSNPKRILDAYLSGRYQGNILSLLEPDFSSLCFLDNARFPADWLRCFDEAESPEQAEAVFNAVCTQHQQEHRDSQDP